MLRSGQVVKKDLCGKNNFIKSVTRILKTWWSASPWPWQLELNWHLSSISQSCFLVIAQYCLCFLSYYHHLWLILEWAVVYNTNTTAVLWPAPCGTTEVRRELEDCIVHAVPQGKLKGNKIKKKKKKENQQEKTKLHCKLVQRNRDAERERQRKIERERRKKKKNSSLANTCAICLDALDLGHFPVDKWSLTWLRRYHNDLKLN